MRVSLGSSSELTEETKTYQQLERRKFCGRLINSLRSREHCDADKQLKKEGALEADKQLEKERAW